MLRELGHPLMRIEEVQETIFGHLASIEAEIRPLERAVGGVLREDVTSRDTIPPFDNSAMDGFGVRLADLGAASESAPVTLKVRRVLAAGAPAGDALEPGGCLRIMTGAPVPAGVEAVIPHELTRHDEGSATFSAPARAGQNIRPAGEDFAPGDVAVTAGTRLRGQHLGIAATLGRAELRVTRRLRVGILSPGDELVEPGEPLAPGKIRNSNAYALRGLLQELGADVVYPGVVRDDVDAVRAAIDAMLEGSPREASSRGPGVDAIVSTGGVSAGDFDHVRTVVERDGAPGLVFKVAMRPGKPQVFGLLGGKPLFGLPGNPAASVLSFEVFVRPALRLMTGELPVLEPRFGVRFPQEFRYKSGRVFLLRAKVVAEDEPGAGFRLERPGAQGSGLVASLAEANAIVLLPAERDRIEADEILPAQWLGGRP